MEPFKNLIHEGLAFELGDRVRAVVADFPTRAFRAAVRGRLEALGVEGSGEVRGGGALGARAGDAARRFGVLTEAVRGIPPIGSDELQSGWAMFPLDMVLFEHGPEAWRSAMDFAYELTQRFTAEFGVRSLLIAQPERTLKELLAWAGDDSVHVRRLVSEGTRPRLPWGVQLAAFVADPRPTRPLLEALADDPEEYVRRSVANHWNDIAKDHPEYVVEAMGQWWRPADPNRVRLVRHACRTLVKQGHGGALALLGHGRPRIDGLRFELRPRKLTLGGTLEARVALQSSAKESQSLIVDYRFHLVRAGGKTGEKVFKGGKLTLAPGAKENLVHRFPLRPVTTRRYYPGKTRVELLINGEVLAEGEFTLLVPGP
ncbi:MAG: DNA alkylation repair protein [Planctomycetota bacterium]